MKREIIAVRAQAARDIAAAGRNGREAGRVAAEARASAIIAEKEAKLKQLTSNHQAALRKIAVLEAQQVESKALEGLRVRLLALSDEYDAIKNARNMDPRLRQMRLAELEERAIRFQEDLARVGGKEYQALARVLFPEASDLQLELLRRAHAHGGPRPASGKWPPAVLEQKMKILRGIDPATGAPLNINGRPVAAAEAFGDEAVKALRVGMAGETAVLEAPAGAAERAASGLSEIAKQYRGAAREAFDTAANRCAQLGLNADEAANVLSHTPTVRWLSEVPEDLLRQVNLPAGPARIAALRRIGSFVQGMEGAGHALDVRILQLVAESPVQDVHPLVKIARSARLGGDAEKIARAMRQFNEWKGAGPVARNLARLGVALEWMAVCFSAEEALSATERINELKASLDEKMRKAKFTFDEGTGQWVHPSGARLEVKTFEKSLDELNNPAWTRVGVDSASALANTAVLVINPALLLHPAGWVVAGVQIVVHGVITTWEQTQNRAFLENIPMPVLALLGTGKPTGMGEADVIAEHSNSMISDLWVNEYINGVRGLDQKDLIRKKAFMAVLYRELLGLQGPHADLFADIVGEEDPIAFFSENGTLFREDFERFFRPYLAVRLFQRSNDGGVQWSDFKDLRTDEGWFDLENVTDTDIRIAAREALVLYAQHRRELTARKQSANPAAVSGGPIDSLADLRARSAAQFDSERRSSTERVFGKELGSLSSLSGGRTYALALVQDLYKRVGDFYERHPRIMTRGESWNKVNVVPAEYRNATRAELIKRYPDLFRVELPEAIRQERSGASVEMSSLPFLLFEREEHEELDRSNFDAYLGMLKVIDADLYPMTRSIQFPQAHYEHLMTAEYLFRQLSRVPALDSDGSLRRQIYRMRTLNWEPHGFLELGDPANVQRQEVFQTFTQSLRNRIQWLEERRYAFCPVERSKQSLQVVSLGYHEYLTHTKSPQLHVVVPGPSGEMREQLLDLGGERQKQFSLPGMGTVVAERVGDEVTWRIEGQQEGAKFYVFEQNAAGIEQPGSWVTIEQPPDLPEVVPPGQDFFIYPHGYFRARLELADGRVIEADYLQDSQWNDVKSRMDPYVTIRAVTDTPQTRIQGSAFGEQTWANEKKQLIARWRKITYGMGFQINDRSMVKRLILTAPGTTRTGERTILDIARSPRMEHRGLLPKKGEIRQVALPEKGDVGKVGSLDLHQNALKYPRHFFNVELTLWDGRRVRGTNTSPEQLIPYLALLPRSVGTNFVIGTDLLPTGVPKDVSKRGWTFVLRNREAVRGMDVHYIDDETGRESGTLHVDIVQPPSSVATAE